MLSDAIHGCATVTASSPIYFLTAFFAISLQTALFLALEQRIRHMKNFICTLAELALFSQLHPSSVFTNGAPAPSTLKVRIVPPKVSSFRNNVADGSAVYETNGAGQDIRRSHIFHADHIDMVIDIVETV